MSLDVKDIRHGSRSNQSRWRRSVDSSGGIRIQSGVGGNFTVAFANTARGDVAESA